MNYEFKVTQGEHPAVDDMNEMAVLDFLFQVKREQIGPTQLQQMLIDHKIQNQLRQIAAENDKTKGSISKNFQPTTSLSLLDSMTSTPKSSYDLIPEPKVVFKYASGEPFPTPSLTPELVEAMDNVAPIDYRKAFKKNDNFREKDRSEFIQLKNDVKAHLTPSSSSHDSSDYDQENTADNLQLLKLTPSSKIKNWCGSSIYNNLPELVMNEYDKMLRESHNMKVEVINALNQEFPVSYDYNPKKSRIRTNYSDPQIACDRTRNNIASRRSRQRKKFQTQMIQYSVDYDTDENFLLDKQEKWLKGIISSLEQKITSNTTDDGIARLNKLRKQCGFE